MMKRVLILSTIFFALAAGIWAAGTPEKERLLSHPSTDSPTSCSVCHLGRVTRGQGDRFSVRFRKDPVSLCLDCHPDQGKGQMHPVDIKPDFAVPMDLPLSEDFFITCTTCHNPHLDSRSKEPTVPRDIFTALRDFFSPPDFFPSYFLRKTNRGGELCQICHEPDLIGVGYFVIDRTFLEQYVGSSSCRPCHGEIYRQWQLTPHARMVQDPNNVPEAVKGLLPDPDITLDINEISFTLGSHWTQRYLILNPLGGDDYDLVVTPYIWNLQTRSWTTSCSFNRSWYMYCAGCHATGFFAPSRQYEEAGIGCEACHGPGERHLKKPIRGTITNPAKLTQQKRLMICMACHTNGHDTTGVFAFPVGYMPGENLGLYFKGLYPKPGQPPETYAGDGSMADRIRQYRYWFDDIMSARGTVCDRCEDYPILPQYEAGVRLTIPQYCGTCHVDEFQNFTAPASGSNCVSCHPPLTTSDGKEYSIHDHKFISGAPLSVPLEVPVGVSPHRSAGS